MARPYRERRAAPRRARAGARAAGAYPPRTRGDGASCWPPRASRASRGSWPSGWTRRYETGRRTGAWVKVKNTQPPGAGHRRLAARRGPAHASASARCSWATTTDDGFRYAGRVGTGFTERTLDELAAELGPLRRDANPFRRRAPKLPREAVFVEPRLVAEIEFVEWTREGVHARAVVQGPARGQGPTRGGARRASAGAEPDAAAPTRPRRCSTRSRPSPTARSASCATGAR